MQMILRLMGSGKNSRFSPLIRIFVAHLTTDRRYYFNGNRVSGERGFLRLLSQHSIKK
jgi:hypothetical protein